ncbi:MAG TPA: tetratricopeptide repeat protein [Candidatus Sulfotelmatobacter sp.]|nr:tetratricopeptide repeat protein [Candidatus Sulfotelmatobacter sp.]
MLSGPRILLVPASLLAFSFYALPSLLWGQVSHSEQVQVKSPLLLAIDPPSPNATAADLEARADELHAQKLYLDAVDYYRAALKKVPNNAHILNKVCRTQLMMQHWRDAKSSCELAIKADRRFADPYSNLGVAFYEAGKYGAAVKQYRKAIALDGTSAAFFNNLGAALFSKKEFEPAAEAYEHAIELDPEVFGRSSRSGVQAQLPSPGDRAHYDFTMAKLFAKMGYSEQSIEYLRKALEEGYRDFKDVYKDVEFAELRKDRRFTELMAAKPPALPE